MFYFLLVQFYTCSVILQSKPVLQTNRKPLSTQHKQFSLPSRYRSTEKKYQRVSSIFTDCEYMDTAIAMASLALNAAVLHHEISKTRGILIQ